MDKQKDDPNEIKQGSLGCCGIMATIVSIFLIIIFFPLAIPFSIKVVNDYKRAVMFRTGVSRGIKGPGCFCIIPCTDKFVFVDMRTITIDIPPQEILTKDSVTISVDAVIYQTVFNPQSYVCNATNASNSTLLLASCALRNVLGTKSLQQILVERNEIAEQLKELVDEATDRWGVTVDRVEIKDVKLPPQLQRAMASEAEATRDAKAKVISAEGEQKASKALKEAADTISQSPTALQLRYLQTLTTISAEKNSTIVFPIPVELLRGIAK
ncbi:hypothetical protein SNEBB_010945 [Seison nebaliae]|nr:hypothetical protein SNEBB_010945 [Seison nebaliae]